MIRLTLAAAALSSGGLLYVAASASSDMDGPSVPEIERTEADIPLVEADPDRPTLRLAELPPTDKVHSREILLRMREKLTGEYALPRDGAAPDPGSGH